MQVEVLETPEALARRAAGIVCATVQAKPNAALGLASGATPLGLYTELAHCGSEVDFSTVAAFAVDELHGVPPDHLSTNASYFRDHRVPRLSVQLMDSAAGDAEAECRRFSRAIAGAGGLDLVVLGIGHNGHLAFNEPGSPFDSRCRRVVLDRSTRAVYVPKFGSLDATPPYGLTLGIADLLAGKRVLLLAIGGDKAGVVAQALEGPLTDRVPASALRGHDNCTALLDRAAAAHLTGYAS